MREIELPAPLTALRKPEDTAADQITAQHKKNHHRLVSGTRHDIRHGKQSPMRCDLPIVHIKKVSPVLKTNKQRRNSAHKVKQCRGVGAGERYAGRRVHLDTSTLQRSSRFFL